MKKFKFIIEILLISSLLIGCGSVYESSKSGYTENTSIAGVSFEMPSSFISKATAISSIVTTEEYDGTFVYKNGTDKYVFFSMKEMLVICGPTKFDWKTNGETSNTLRSTDILGAWLTIDDVTDGFSSDSKTSDGVYKIVYDTSADYSLTPTNYNSFKGYGATINDGTNEYSIFAGVTSEDVYKDNKATLQHIVKSLKFTGTTVISSDSEENTDEALDDESTSQKVEEAPAETVEENTEEEPVEVPETSESEIAADTTEEIIETETIESDPATSEDKEEEEEIISTQSSDDEDDVQEVASEPEKTEEKEEKEAVDKEDKSKESLRDSVFSDDTEELLEKVYNEVGQIKVSTVYTPLAIGEYGECYTLSNTGDQNLNAVTILEVLNKTDATDIIKERKGRKAEPTVGTHFEAAHIRTTANLNSEYLDVKIEGMDGERLVYRGVSYTTRAYDLLVLESNETNETWVYYEVPNGCKEYLLEIGLQAKEVNVETASYKIKTSL